VNFVAHMVVAHRVADAPSTALLLGAAAPDLARMARLPVATAGSADLLAGVATHHRTDAVFHELSWFRDHNRRLVRDLAERGVRRGPARGAAHVLIELLLDGALLADPGHGETFARPWGAMSGPDDDALAVVDPAHHDRWADFLDQLTTRLDPTAYGDPSYAAARTANALSRRPRLALTDGETAGLRHVAAEIQPAITAETERVLTETAAATGSPTSGAGRAPGPDEPHAG
jgi:hypothetical protein